MSEDLQWRPSTPLYEDPIYGGASDPTVIWNPRERVFFLFYTQRRAYAHQLGVASIHGTDIGIASSVDGRNWCYRGVAEGLAWEHGHNTFWAPEVLWAQGCYHMYVSYVQGVPCAWGTDASIHHYTSDDLWQWRHEGALDLGSHRVIDACVCPVGDRYKLWYKDEDRGSHTCAALSEDLYHWRVCGEEITDCPHEGPYVFTLGARAWMLTDTWHGLAVYSSEDYTHWVRQKALLLDRPGVREKDGDIGNHASVLVQGSRAVLFYFVHPAFPAAQRADFQGTLTPQQAETVIQACELRLTGDGQGLYCDRDAGLVAPLAPGRAD